MKIIKSKIKNAFIIDPTIHSDNRGSFMELYKVGQLTNFKICQINQAISKKKCIRGLHFQKKPFQQAKLVWVPEGEVLDIIVDLNPKSETYLLHDYFKLSSSNNRMLFVPKGCAHGYITKTNKVVFNYALDEIYNPKFDAGVNFFDSKINIKLDFDVSQYELSKKDETLPFLKDITL